VAAAVGRGDEAAFREMYDRYHERLFRLSLVLGHGDDHARRRDWCKPYSSPLRRSSAASRAKSTCGTGSRALPGNSSRKMMRQTPPGFNRRERCGFADCADVREHDSVLEETLDAALLRWMRKNAN